MAWPTVITSSIYVPFIHVSSCSVTPLDEIEKFIVNNRSKELEGNCGVQWQQAETGSTDYPGLEHSQAMFHVISPVGPVSPPGSTLAMSSSLLLRTSGHLNKLPEPWLAPCDLVGGNTPVNIPRAT